MDTNIKTVRQKLVDVQDEIRRGAFRSRQLDRNNGWGGAGVIFSRERPAAASGAKKGFYPETKYVTTTHAGEAGWLLNKLRDIFSDAGLIDSCSKIEFFGRLANAAFCKAGIIITVSIPSRWRRLKGLPMSRHCRGNCRLGRAVIGAH